MEEEIYIEESNPFKVKITIIVILVLLSVAFVLFVILKNRYTLTLDDVHIEIGEKLPKDVDFFVENKVVDDSDYKIYIKNFPVDSEGRVNEVGVFEYKLK